MEKECCGEGLIRGSEGRGTASAQERANLCHHRIRAQSSMSAQQSHYFGIYARLNNNNNNNNTMGMASSNMQPDAKGIIRGTVHDIPYLVEHDWPSTHNHT
jgi:hypothetical protein